MVQICVRVLIACVMNEVMVWKTNYNWNEACI